MATDILQALNEIQAQLAALTLDGDPPVTPGETLNAIAANIEALRATLEARSVAETVGQNTNFDDLIAQIALIRLSCCPPAIFIGGAPVADIPPADPGAEFDDPPPSPFQQTDEAPGSAGYYSRKCSVATWLVDDLYYAFKTADDWLLDEVTNVGFVFLLGAWGSLAAELLGTTVILGVSMATIAGYLSGIARYAWANAEGLEYGPVHAAALARRDDLICALFEATTAEEARGNINTILDEEAVNDLTRGLVLVLYDAPIINYLFAKNEQSIEDRLFFDNYPGDCAGCENCTPGVTDTFTDTNGVGLLSHVPDVSDCGPWSNARGTWTIDTNQAKSNGAVGSLAVIGSGTPDGTITCDVTLVSTGANQTAFQGLAFRYSDNAAYWIFVWDGGAEGPDRLSLRKRVSNSYQTVASEDLVLSGTHEFKVVLNGPSIECYLDSELKFSVEDSYLISETAHGIRSGEASGARFDNFEVV